jgi:hypothetical protein
VDGELSDVVIVVSSFVSFSIKTLVEKNPDAISSLGDQFEKTEIVGCPQEASKGPTCTGNASNSQGLECQLHKDTEKARNQFFSDGIYPQTEKLRPNSLGSIFGFSSSFVYSNEVCGRSVSFR